MAVDVQTVGMPHVMGVRAETVVLGLIGAAAIVVSVFVPVSGSGGYSYKILDVSHWNASQAVFAIEPLAVAVFVFFALIVPSAAPLRRGALCAFGVQTIAGYLGYVLSPLVSHSSDQLRVGAFVGLAGAGLLLVAAAVDRPPAQFAVQQPFAAVVPTPSVEATKTCPRCAETVREAAQVCRFCGHSFARGKAAT